MTKQELYARATALQQSRVVFTFLDGTREGYFLIGPYGSDAVNDDTLISPGEIAVMSGGSRNGRSHTDILSIEAA